MVYLSFLYNRNDNSHFHGKSFNRVKEQTIANGIFIDIGSLQNILQEIVFEFLISNKSNEK